MIVDLKDYDKYLSHETIDRIKADVSHSADSSEDDDDSSEDPLYGMEVFLLTTIDNPFDPYKDFDNWLRYDEDHKYYTLNYLARVAPTSEYLTEVENQRIVNDAIDDICRLDLLGIYKRVKVK